MNKSSRVQSLFMLCAALTLLIPVCGFSQDPTDIDSSESADTDFSDLEDTDLPDIIDTVDEPDETEGKLLLTKDAETRSFSAVGEEIVYWFGLTNTGEQDISNIIVTDPLLGFSGTVQNLKASGTSVYFNATYIVTQADLEAGNIENTATASGMEDNSGIITAVASFSIPRQQSPQEPVDGCFWSNLPWDFYGGLAALLATSFGIMWLAEDSPCMVATAAYGTPLAGQIGLLRLFRDTCMLESSLGTALVDVYYHGGGLLAGYVTDHAWAAWTARLILIPMLIVVALSLFAPQTMLLIMVLSATSLFAALLYFY
ncbi:MAG: hypothetical protein GX117_08945, partial [Candidatus Hydrogenedentes bacterium]|nr:hypothetical protein [Candidatus Hydrogenedentota bacterium]